MKVLLCIILLALPLSAQQPDMVAILVPRAVAVQALHGECLPRALLTPYAGELKPGHILLVLRRDSLQDEPTLTAALHIAAGTAFHSTSIRAGEPIPDDWHHLARYEHFRQIGRDVPLVRFCE